VILDEVAAHMDRGRAQSLYDQLAMTGAQVFLSATHADAVTGARGCRIIDMGPQEVAHAQPIGA
jgi:recombinational DNA repair ATPase RecF